MTRLFGDMGAREQEILADYFQAWKIDAGTNLFREGDRGDYLAVVVAGRVQILKDDGYGHLTPLTELHSGMALGEMALIDGEPRSATARMIETGTLLVLSAGEFDRMLLDRPVLAFRILRKLAKGLSQKLRQTTGRLVDHISDFPS
ncbi:MAG: cyclic nucleotide-binding domain-containing protein [Fibrobacteria bacterium]|nr:cyclic nucleotide-binding domain-containing protein [Fibrobacteria bacterium]